MAGEFDSYQSEIYFAGLSEKYPPCTTSGTALEDSAREIMEPGPFGYVAGCAGAGKTAEANRAAFDKWRIVPRMLRDATGASVGHHRGRYQNARSDVARTRWRAIDRASGR